MSVSELETQSDLRDSVPLRQRLVWLYAVVLGTVGGAIIAADEAWPQVGWLTRNGPNFGADFIGLAITLLLIDRIVSWRREAELHPVRASAVRRLGKAVRDLEIQMAWLFKAASGKQVEPESVDGLIDAFVSAVGRLDFSAESPAGPPWKVFLPERLNQISVALDNTVSRYEEVLPPRLSAAIDAVVDDASFRLLSNVGALSTALEHVSPSDLLPARNAFADALKSLYREYSEFRGRPFALVAWELPRPWGDAIAE